MGNIRIGGIYVVAATKGGQTEYWVAATRRDEALAAVQQVLPAGWRATTVTDRRLTPEQVESLKLRPHDVRKLKEAP